MIDESPATMSVNASPDSQRPHSSAYAKFGLGAAILLILFVTLTPQSSVTPHHDIRIFTGWSRKHIREDVLNALLFVPLGASAAGLSFKSWQTFALAFGVSSLVELLQRLVVPGRFAELQDVVSNTVGAMLAYGLVMLIRNWWSARVNYRTSAQ